MWSPIRKPRCCLLILFGLCIQFLLIFLLISYSSKTSQAFLFIQRHIWSEDYKKEPIYTSIIDENNTNSKEAQYFTNKNNKLNELLDKNGFKLKGDYSRLINLTDFNFTLINNHGCSHKKDGKNPFLLILVVTSPKNHDRRKIIRETWGNVTDDLKLVFLMAAVDSETQRAVEDENDIYRDIVQGNFMDTYKNLTYKTVMSLKYVVYHCPFAKYVLKIDDDAVANIPLLKHFLKKQIARNFPKNLLMCDVLVKKSPLRNRIYKWYVSEDDFAGKYYPDYCPGWLAMFTPDAMFRLYREAQKTKYFWLEDVFLYGIVAEKVPGLKHTDMTVLTTTWYYPKLILNGKYGNVTFLFGGPDFDNELMLNFWKYIQKHSSKMFAKIDLIWYYLRNQTKINQASIHGHVIGTFNKI